MMEPVRLLALALALLVLPGEPLAAGRYFSDRDQDVDQRSQEQTSASGTRELRERVWHLEKIREETLAALEADSTARVAASDQARRLPADDLEQLRGQMKTGRNITKSRNKFLRIEMDLVLELVVAAGEPVAYQRLLPQSPP